MGACKMKQLHLRSIYLQVRLGPEEDPEKASSFSIFPRLFLQANSNPTTLTDSLLTLVIL